MWAKLWEYIGWWCNALRVPIGFTNLTVWVQRLWVCHVVLVEFGIMFSGVYSKWILRYLESFLSWTNQATQAKCTDIAYTPYHTFIKLIFHIAKLPRTHRAGRKIKASGIGHLLALGVEVLDPWVVITGSHDCLVAPQRRYLIFWNW